MMDKLYDSFSMHWFHNATEDQSHIEFCALADIRARKRYVRLKFDDFHLKKGKVVVKKEHCHQNISSIAIATEKSILRRTN